MSFQDNGDRDKVLAATDIVRMISEQVNLKPKGKEFAGLCPFHDDKTPSMQVSPQKQIYKCFSCGAGGTAFDFVMNYHKMTFPESMKYLADRAGIELTPWKPERGGAEGEQRSNERAEGRKALAQANQQAVEFFRAMLRHPEHGKDAREYLDRRGVTADMIETFQLGYAPDKWDGLVSMIQHKNWTRDAFVNGGLTKPRKTGDGDFDFLRHRLVFPIFDAIGRPIAFGGRKLREEDDPKYLNSPETLLFNKSATLYGLHAAKKPIIDSKTAVIVEGYTDVIACHQAGASNVVAALGTALTAEHVRELRRYCEQVILVMDGDAAGQKAADRAIEVFLTGDLDVSIVVLPGGQDPDELLKEGGLERWQEVLDSAEDAISFQFSRVTAQLDTATTITGRQKVAETFMGDLLEMGLAQTGSVRRSFVVRRLASLVHMSESEVDRWLRDRAPRRAQAVKQEEYPTDSNFPSDTDFAENNVPNEVASTHSRHRLKSVGSAERRLIACLVRDNGLFQQTLPDGSAVDEAIAPAELANSEHRGLYSRIYDALSEGKTVSLAGLLGDLASRGEHDMIRLATDADHELEQIAGDQPERCREVLLDAVRFLVAHREENEYHAFKHDQAPTQDPQDAALAAAQIIQRRAEMLTRKPSPGTIARR